MDHPEYLSYAYMWLQAYSNVIKSSYMLIAIFCMSDDILFTRIIMLHF